MPPSSRGISDKLGNQIGIECLGMTSMVREKQFSVIVLHCNLDDNWAMLKK